MVFKNKLELLEDEDISKLEIKEIRHSGISDDQMLEVDQGELFD